jgi:hypothetical protein
MPSSESHNIQVLNNIQFLQSVCSLSPSKNYDWKITICFYTALHIVNSFLAIKINAHYQTHSATERAINPYIHLNPCKVTVDVYLAYKKLHNLSRRSRYLINEKPEFRSDDASPCWSSEKFYSKAKNNLSIIVNFFSDKIGIEKTEISHL